MLFIGLAVQQPKHTHTVCIHNISGGVKFPQGYGLAWSLSASLDDIVGIAFDKYNYKETVGCIIL